MAPAIAIPSDSDGVTRTYYISSDPAAGDYAPTGRNQITRKPFDSVAATYTDTARGRMHQDRLAG